MTRTEGRQPTATMSVADATEIVFALPLYTNVVAHAVRKLTGYYLAGETEEPKAFGMLAGRYTETGTGTGAGTGITVTAVFPLVINIRHDATRRCDMDELVTTHAIPSETPLARRGWIADPRELMAIERACDATDWMVFGNYHTHRVGWPQDPRRDTCTGLDRALAAESGQWTLILSVVDLHHPRLRAFFEGDNDREAPIRIVPEQVPPGSGTRAGTP